MICPIPDNESSRLDALRSLNILDTTPDLRFELATRFLAREVKVPMVLVTLIDADRQWFKAAFGVDEKQMPREISICAHAICEITSANPIDRIYEVSDLKMDLRFFKNPLVTNAPNSRSYISYILQSECNKNIGTLCLVDVKPRIFMPKERELIMNVGTLVNKLITG